MTRYVPKHILLVSILFLIGAIFYSRIIYINPSTQLIGDGGDTFEYFGYIYLTHQNITHFKNPFAPTNTLLYPYGFDYSSGFDGAFFILGGALLHLFLDLPVAYNIMIVVVIWLNALLSYLMFYLLLKQVLTVTRNNYLLAGIGSLLFGWSPYVFARINGHMNLSFVAGFPIFFCSLYLLYDNLKNNLTVLFRHMMGVGFGFLLILMGSLQYGLLMLQFVLFLSLIFVCTYIIRRRRKTQQLHMALLKQIVQYSLITMGLVCVPFLFLFGGYVKAILGNTISTYGLHGNPLSVWPMWTDLFIPNRYLGEFWSIINPSKPSIERVATFGPVGWIIIVIILLREKKQLNQFFLLGTLILLSSSILFVRPYLVPEPGRIWIVASFPILSYFLVRFYSKSLFVYFTLILLLLTERSFYSVKTIKTLPWKEAEVIKNLPGKAVLHIPLANPKYQITNMRSALPYFWEKSIIDGSFIHTARNEGVSTFLTDPILNQFVCGNEYGQLTSEEKNLFFQKLNQWDIRTVVLIKQGGNQELWWYKECANVRRTWNDLFPEYAVVSQGEKVTEHRFEFGREGEILGNLIFNYDGLVRLERLTVWPTSINDLSMSSSEGVLINPPWKQLTAPKDLIYDLFPRIFLPVQSGEMVSVKSSKQNKNGNVYVALYYLYTPHNLSNNITKPLPFNRVLKNDMYEIITF